MIYLPHTNWAFEAFVSPGSFVESGGGDPTTSRTTEKQRGDHHHAKP